jgi:hypothetical protein
VPELLPDGPTAREIHESYARRPFVSDEREANAAEGIRQMIRAFGRREPSAREEQLIPIWAQSAVRSDERYRRDRGAVAFEDGLAATRFSFGPLSGHPHARIDIEVRTNAFRPGVSWVVFCDGWTCSHNGRWLYERIPGERTERYIRQTRWADRDAAILVARRLIADGHPNTEAWTRGRRMPR